jgi:YfiH family protein
MILTVVGGLRYFHFESLDREGVVNGFFTRRGGVSPAPWNSLNLGGTTGDSCDNVIENRKRIFECVRKAPETIFDVWQVHGTNAICAENPRPSNSEHQKADIILTNRPAITLLMRFADCVPILLFDPVNRVVGIVHAGWMGTVRKALVVAVDRMANQYHTQPQKIIAAIGPSIGPDHYEVRSDVIGWVKKAFSKEEDQVLVSINGKISMDLCRANEIVLQNCGVEQIELAQICTACNTEDWYSHRAEKGATGRFGAIIALR